MRTRVKSVKRCRPTPEVLEARALLATRVSFADSIEEVVVDPAGNVFALGEIRNPMDFDPGPGTAWHFPPPPGPTASLADYLVSYAAADGSLQPGWPVQLPFFVSSIHKPLATDSLGQVHIGGGLDGIGRLATYDANGLQVWSLAPTVSVGASGGSFAFFNVAADSTGLYASGHLQGDIQVDLNGDSVVDLTHSSTETDGDFIAKFNLNTHALEWAMQIRGDSSHGTSALASDGQTLYASGGFSGFPGIYGYHVLTGTPFEMTDADLGTYTNVAGDSYVIAIDPATGTITHAAHLIDTELGSLAVDGTALYAGGQSFVNGPGDLDPGPAQRLIQGGFAARYGADLSLGWASGLAVSVADIAVAGGQVYGTGGTGSTVDFDPGPGTYNLTTLGRSDGFVWALNASTGTFSWARIFGSTGPAPTTPNDGEGGASIAANAAGVYAVGTMNYGIADFDRTASYADNRDLRSNDTDTDGITLKLDSATGAFGWVNQIGDVHRTIDDEDAGYTETGSGWKNGQPTAGGYLNDFRTHAKGSGSNTARWSFTGLPAGTYEVWATWIANSKYATDARYRINGVAQALVNQRVAPNDYTDGISQPWKVIGTVTVASGGSVTVELSDQANGTVAADAMRVVFKTPPALRAASVGSVAGEVAGVGLDQVAPLLKAARRRWARLGFTTRLLKRLDVQIADLPGDRLAEIAGRTLTIDTDAAGRGWFIDAAPRRRAARPATASQKYDLLTVLAHEMGHALGLGHRHHGVMAETLEPGIRRLPGARLARSLAAHHNR
jgi:hypothetical protein